MKFNTAHSSRLGNRKNNQDRCAIYQRDRYVLLVLADGMGGHKGGEKAAQEVLNTFETVFNNISIPIKNKRAFLQQLSLLAHKAIQEKHSSELNIPRTTCVCCLIFDNKAIWAHSGDSRLYLFREQHMHFRTRDHSYIEDMLQYHAITEQEALTHPMRNYVTACLGGSASKPHISVSESMTLKSGDILLLCSDGLWSAVDNKTIMKELDTKKLEQAIDKLTDLSEKASYPNSDNSTGLVIKIEDSAPPSGIVLTHLQQLAIDNKSDLDKAINDIEAAYHVYKKEL